MDRDVMRDVDAYVDAWTPEMISIWQEKIRRMKVMYTGALHQSFSQRIDRLQSGATSIELRFLQYGIYQAMGVGKGYAKDNGGDLQFLGNEYRREHGYNIPRRVGPKPGGYLTSGNPREKRDWFSRKLFSSYRNMVEDLARIMAENAAHVVCDQLMNTRDALR